MENDQLSELITNFGYDTILSRITLPEILKYLRTSNGLNSFLLLVTSRQLGQAKQQREERQDLQVRENRRAFLPNDRENVASFTMDELLSQCAKQGIIQEMQYYQWKNNRRSKSCKYFLSHHSQLGIQLVRQFPNRYYVGKSTHFNESAKLDAQYAEYLDQENSEGNIGRMNQQNQSSEEQQQNQGGEDLQNGELIVEDQDEEQQEQRQSQWIVEDDAEESLVSDGLPDQESQEENRNLSKINSKKSKRINKRSKQDKKSIKKYKLKQNSKINNQNQQDDESILNDFMIKESQKTSQKISKSTKKKNTIQSDSD